MHPLEIEMQVLMQIHMKILIMSRDHAKSSLDNLEILWKKQHDLFAQWEAETLKYTYLSAGLSKIIVSSILSLKSLLTQLVIKDQSRNIQRIVARAELSKLTQKAGLKVARAASQHYLGPAGGPVTKGINFWAGLGDDLNNISAKCVEILRTYKKRPDLALLQTILVGWDIIDPACWTEKIVERLGDSLITDIDIESANFVKFYNSIKKMYQNLLKTSEEALREAQIMYNKR